MADLVRACVTVGWLADRPANPADHNEVFVALDDGTIYVCAPDFTWTPSYPTFDESAPTTTKGDLIAHNGSVNVRMPVGTDDKILTADSTQSSGLAWTARRPPDLEIFGDGSDGDATITGIVTLTKDMYYNNLTIQTGAIFAPSGHRIFVKGTLDITAAPAGWFTRNGGSGSGTTGGTAPSSHSVGGAPGGSNSPVATAAQGTAGTVGDAGGASGAGGRSGNQSLVAASVSPTGRRVARIAVDLIYGADGALLGGSGAGSGSTGSNATAGGGGGGAPVLLIAAHTISRGGSTTADGITAKGGNGGTGGGAGVANGSGGGGGGGGGWVFIIYHTLSGSTATNLINVSGGAGGAGGNAVTNGGSGGGGGSGGRVTLVNIANGTITETVGGAGSAGSLNTGTTGGAGGAGATTQVSL